MKSLICDRCGGTINPKTDRCEYCGTYHFREVPIGYINISPKVEVLNAEIRVDNAMVFMYKEHFGELATNEITRKIAEGIAKYIEYTVQEDPHRDQQVVRGRIRVLPPDYRF